MDARFDFITALQYEVKKLRAIVAGFESGERYLQIKNHYLKNLEEKNHTIAALKKELADACETIIRIRQIWFEVFDDLEKAYKKENRKLIRELEEEKKKRFRAEAQRDEYHDKYRKKCRELYESETLLEEEKGKNRKLTAQINRDHENSSLPSSRCAGHKKITNSREKTGRRPGGQPGHTGHCRKKQEVATPPVLLPPPQEVLEDPDFKKTKKTIKKQLINVRVVLEVQEYHADVYYNSKTGERRHAAFPDGITDDVNYGGSIRAFLFLLNHDCHTSIDKSRRFLSDLTGGKLNLSKGMVSKLSGEFARKTETERKKIFADLLLSPVMHADFTNAKMNGKSVNVLVCAATDGKTLYFAREKKGHEGIKGTPAEDYQGILVHDHDKTFYHYGADHQECLAHVLRYLKNSMENEPDRTWNREMHALLQEMIHYRNQTPEEEWDHEKVSGLKKRYQEILKKAKDEYDDVPANDYYKDGYNLFLRLEEYMSNHLLFLEDHRVPPTNNEAERLLRDYKRKQQQAVTFRSFESLENLCQCMSMLVMMRKNGEQNIYDRVSEIFGQGRPMAFD
ncbi:MAG: transposase [Lachnospiraceae bacterium]|nr:transposase [Lachnospiraceae bacterium]